VADLRPAIAAPSSAVTIVLVPPFSRREVLKRSHREIRLHKVSNINWAATAYKPGVGAGKLSPVPAKIAHF
jgi:hypothetical protein